MASKTKTKQRITTYTRSTFTSPPREIPDSKLTLIITVLVEKKTK